MSDISKPLIEIVIQRAGNRCEYRQLSQVGQEAAFHIDHIVPRKSEGPTVLTNLALACVSCSLRKGAKEFATDSTTGEIHPLFHPRLQRWEDHFEWLGVVVVARSNCGRVTMEALSMNRPSILQIRTEEVFFDRHPST